MCKIRTPLTVWGLFAFGLIGCGDEVLNCEQVTGVYYPQFELIDMRSGDGQPADCSEIPLEKLDLTGDNTIQNSTSVEFIDVWSGGCEFTIDYTRTVTLEDDLSGELLVNNGGSKYRVEAGGVLRGQAVYHRFDRTGRESCIALFDATWLTEEMVIQMMGTAL